MDQPDTPAAEALPPASFLSQARQQLLQKNSQALPPTDALPANAVQESQYVNAEVLGNAAATMAIPPDMLISRAAAQVAQTGADYFDGFSKIALASQSVLLRKMTEKFAAGEVDGAAKDAMGALVTDLLMGAAAAVAAASGAIEAQAASFAIDKIDQSLSRYNELIGQKKRD